MNFSIEEHNLMCIYIGDNRAEAIANIQHMMTFLTPEETELRELSQTVLRKLQQMTDEQYDALSDQLIPDFLNPEE